LLSIEETKPDKKKLNQRLKLLAGDTNSFVNSPTVHMDGAEETNLSVPLFHIRGSKKLFDSDEGTKENSTSPSGSYRSPRLKSAIKSLSTVANRRGTPSNRVNRKAASPPLKNIQKQVDLAATEPVYERFPTDPDEYSTTDGDKRNKKMRKPALSKPNGSSKDILNDRTNVGSALKKDRLSLGSAQSKRFSSSSLKSSGSAQNLSQSSTNGNSSHRMIQARRSVGAQSTSALNRGGNNRSAGDLNANDSYSVTKKLNATTSIADLKSATTTLPASATQRKSSTKKASTSKRPRVSSAKRSSSGMSGEASRKGRLNDSDQLTTNCSTSRTESSRRESSSKKADRSPPNDRPRKSSSQSLLQDSLSGSTDRLYERVLVMKSKRLRNGTPSKTSPNSSVAAMSNGMILKKFGNGSKELLDKMNNIMLSFPQNSEKVNLKFLDGYGDNSIEQRRSLRRDDRTPTSARAAIKAKRLVSGTPRTPGSKSVATSFTPAGSNLGFASSSQNRNSAPRTRREFLKF